MKVIVGSKNPVKVNATKAAFSKFFSDVEVKGESVDSGVSDMPLTAKETRLGAINRAKRSLELGADYGVGLEGGVEDTDYGMFLFGRVAIIDKNNNVGLSGAEGFLLPEIIAKRIRQGEELGPVMDDVTGLPDVKKNAGAVGIFTKNEISRTDSFEKSIILALVKFINKEIYGLEWVLLK